MTLFLLPNVFTDEQPTHLLLPEGLEGLVGTLDALIAESERTGRRYLMKILKKAPLAREMPIHLLSEHSKKSDYADLVELVASKNRVGLISDAGMPGIADPGSLLVHQLRHHGIHQIKAVPGPSSIILALLVSGLPSTPYSFHGYLPQEQTERKKMLKLLEKTPETHIFIEVPYRNSFFFDDCLATLAPTTKLCLAANMTFENENVQVHSIQTWKRLPKPDIHKVPVVFLMHSTS
jgi:16S rRNA (cytidine1402-2'-O)-methyltransferase